MRHPFFPQVLLKIQQTSSRLELKWWAFRTGETIQWHQTLQKNCKVMRGPNQDPWKTEVAYSFLTNTFLN